MISKIRRGIRRAANAVDVEIHRHKPWQWSCSVEEYYPVTPVPRWGYGKPVHPQIAQTLDSRRNDISAFLGRMSRIEWNSQNGAFGRRSEFGNAVLEKRGVPISRRDGSRYHAYDLYAHTLFRDSLGKFYKIRTPHN